MLLCPLCGGIVAQTVQPRNPMFTDADLFQENTGLEGCLCFVPLVELENRLRYQQELLNKELSEKFPEKTKAEIYTILSTYHKEAPIRINILRKLQLIERGTKILKNKRKLMKSEEVIEKETLLLKEKGVKGEKLGFNSWMKTFQTRRQKTFKDKK